MITVGQLYHDSHNSITASDNRAVTNDAETNTNTEVPYQLLQTAQEFVPSVFLLS